MGSLLCSSYVMLAKTVLIVEWIVGCLCVEAWLLVSTQVLVVSTSSFDLAQAQRRRIGFSDLDQDVFDYTSRYLFLRFGSRSLADALESFNVRGIFLVEEKVNASALQPD
ncbi:hypothetical protein YC2023_065383 [Brassica napus]